MVRIAPFLGYDVMRFLVYNSYIGTSFYNIPSLYALSRNSSFANPTHVSIGNARCNVFKRPVVYPNNHLTCPSGRFFEKDPCAAFRQ